MRSSFIIPRISGDMYTRFAIVSLEGKWDQPGLLEAITAAVTKWVRQTQAGQRRWQDSAEEFNLVDLEESDFTARSELGQILAEHGVVGLEIEMRGHAPWEKCAWTVETVLVDEADLEEEEPSWADSHSVTCATCETEADERQCVPGPGGEGSICPSCQDSPERAKQDARLRRVDYRPDEFRRYFTTPFEQYRERIGEPFTVLGRDFEAEEDLDEPEPMYRIRFADGEQIVAWGHEVCLLNYPECH